MIKQLQLLDGTKIDTATGEVVVDALLAQPQTQTTGPIDSNAEMSGLLEGQVKRSLDDIKIDPRMFRIMLAVFAGSAWGLRTHDIAKLFEVDINQVNIILDDEQYIDLSEEIFRALKLSMRENVEGLLMNSAHDAANVLKEQLYIGSNDTKRMAAKDILDRTGFGRTDNMNVKIDEEFIIRYVEEKSINKTMDL